MDDFSRFALNVMGVKDNGNTLENAKAGIVALQSFIKDELVFYNLMYKNYLMPMKQPIT